ncbi:MAG: RES family NAD+ phosphorylase [Marinagarivorans sp.]|nr:RES family NAD+ phosphorylase [Marinagarivorans sp.]
METSQRLWQQCQGKNHIVPISGTLYRLVESQEQVATLSYVDTLEEQALLEELLETVKPPCPAHTQGLHYLLTTPFRYPPLKWGSRFGRAYEPSLFYGGGSVQTTLAECAYYRFLFWYSIAGKPIKDVMHSAHTLFSVGYKTTKGIRLQQPPFDQYAALLTDPQHYQDTQLTGSAMRDADVEAFEYCSARDPGQGHCVALFTAKAFSQKKPKESSQWLCEISTHQVAFKQAGQNTVTRFALDIFLCDGQLPMPA